MGNYGHRPDPKNPPLMSHIYPIGSPIVGIRKDIIFDINFLAILFFLGMKLRGYQGITMFQHCDKTNQI